MKLLQVIRSKAGVSLAVAVLAAISSLLSPADAAGPYPVAEVARAEFTLPPTVLTPNTENFECLARTYPTTPLGHTPIRVFCYNAPAPQDPTPPTAFGPADHLEFNATLLAGGEFFVPPIPCLYFSELTPPTALRITMRAQLDKVGGPASGTVTVRQNTDPDVEFIRCSGGTETTGPLTLTPLDDEVPPHNEDGEEVEGYPGVQFDSCPDWNELGSDPTKGGLRDPFNPYDFYDVSGDGQVSLTLDILPVLLRWSPNPQEPYAAQYDRGAIIGPNSWNKAGPDGQISLTFDILGVILQWQHTCN